MVHQHTDHKMRNTDIANDLNIGFQTDVGLSFPSKVKPGKFPSQVNPAGFSCVELKLPL